MQKFSIAEMETLAGENNLYLYFTFAAAMVTFREI